MLPRAVLFELDGVLADTENIHVAAWERTFGAMGLDVPVEECVRAVGMDDRVFLAQVFADRKIAAGDAEGWALRKQRVTAELLADSPRVDPGAVELALRLRDRGVGLAVVSTSWKANVVSVIRAAGLADAFPVIVSRDDFSAWHPGDPQGFRKALRRLKVPYRQAIALVGGSLGYMAAMSARVKSVVVGNRAQPVGWEPRSAYLGSLADVDEAVAMLERWAFGLGMGG